MFEHDFVLIQRKVQDQNYINPVLVNFLKVKKKAHMDKRSSGIIQGLV